ncbi:MAG: PIN domain-containing protein, partial [Candidatus Xenobia bacterium]
SELLHGVHRADSEVRRIRREAFVERILASVQVFAFDLPIARVYSRVWANQVARGQTVAAHDLMIAATAMALGYEVATSNLRDYARIEGLRVFHVTSP